jgi:hypothetical protein
MTDDPTQTPTPADLKAAGELIDKLDSMRGKLTRGDATLVVAKALADARAAIVGKDFEPREQVHWLLGLSTSACNKAAIAAAGKGDLQEAELAKVLGDVLYALAVAYNTNDLNLFGFIAHDPAHWKKTAEETPR